MGLIPQMSTDLSSLRGELEGYRLRLEALEEESKIIKAENVHLNSEVQSLKSQLADLRSRPPVQTSVLEGRIELAEHYSRRENILVSGLPPPSKDEPAIDIAIDLCGKVGVAIQPGDIQACHRLPSRSGEFPFIMKFVNRHTKDLVLMSAR